MSIREAFGRGRPPVHRVRARSRASELAVGFFVRIRIAESPIFEEARRAQLTRRMPVVDVLRSDARAVIRVIIRSSTSYSM